MLRLVSYLSVIACLGLSSVAGAKAPAFGPIPVEGKTKTSLQMRVVEYKGGTNGKMLIEVRNDGAKVEAFKAKGIYFVPDGEAEKAPQRLGAAGPFEAQLQGEWTTMKDLKVQPGAVVQMKLDVFCIDSHRASPNSSTKFSFATKRLPKELTKKIESGTKHLMKEKKVKNAIGAKGAVQGYIWKTRDAKWIKLQGERKDEKKRTKSRRNRMQRNAAPMQERQ
jgi:hypothetical protein